MVSRRGAVVLAIVAFGSSGASADGPLERVAFSRDVRPILAANCFACHGPDAGSREASLRLDRREDATVTLDSGVAAVVPGDLSASELVFRITSEDEIKAAIFNPPETSRAFFRGRAVARFNDQISSIQWDEIVFSNGACAHRVALPEAAMDGRLDALNHAAHNGKDFTEFMSAIAQIG